MGRFIMSGIVTTLVRRKQENMMQELNGLSEKLDAIKQEILTGMETLDSSKAVYEFKKSFLDSKTGKIGQLMKGMKDIPPQERANYGKSVNALKEWALAQFEELDVKSSRYSIKPATCYCYKRQSHRA